MTKTTFIAEVSSNHNNDLNRCIQFIDVASAIGCDAVKFQLFKVDELFAPEILKTSQKHRDRANWELSVEFVPALADRCRFAGIEFGCTPFFLDAVEILDPYVDFFKISSYELLWDELLARCAKTGKPVIVSTGMAVISEVEHAVDILKSNGCNNPVLLHCVSNYPTKPDECNLASIKYMREKFACDVGWSDHSVQTSVVNRAVNHWQASHVEFHLDLDKTGSEFAGRHCWLPGEIEPVIHSIREGFIADGVAEKCFVESESEERMWRADPKDGLRPLRSVRKMYKG
ncbi:MAG: N-acetylneuraminate synthase family protein [Gammaproteobacteria bacterium]|nr:N-acetylneuraminate synthase family protein [Gammaproteobacteria bacterium]